MHHRFGHGLCFCVRLKTLFVACHGIVNRFGHFGIKGLGHWNFDFQLTSLLNRLENGLGRRNGFGLIFGTITGHVVCDWHVIENGRCGRNRFGLIFGTIAGHVVCDRHRLILGTSHRLLFGFMLCPILCDIM